MTNPQCTTTMMLTKHQVKLYNSHSTESMVHNGKLSMWDSRALWNLWTVSKHKLQWSHWGINLVQIAQCAAAVWAAGWVLDAVEWWEPQEKGCGLVLPLCTAERPQGPARRAGTQRHCRSQGLSSRSPDYGTLTLQGYKSSGVQLFRVPPWRHPAWGGFVFCTLTKLFKGFRCLRPCHGKPGVEPVRNPCLTLWALLQKAFSPSQCKVFDGRSMTARVLPEWSVRKVSLTV